MKQSPAGMQQLTSPQALMPPPVRFPTNQQLTDSLCSVALLRTILHTMMARNAPKDRGQRLWKAVVSGLAQATAQLSICVFFAAFFSFGRLHGRRSRLCSRRMSGRRALRG